MITATPGLKEALALYAATQDARQRSAIYAHSIAPAFRNRSFALGPILAENSLGSLAGELVTQRSLTLLKQTFAPLLAIAGDFSDKSVKFGSQIVTRIPGIPSVSNYVPGTGYTTSDAESTDVTLAIDKHKGVEISFNANELASTNRDLFGEQAEAAHYALGKAFADALFGLVTAANFSHETVSALADFNRGKTNALAQTLTGRGVPAFNRFLLLNTEYFGQLGNDSSLVNLAAFQRPELITEYALPRVSGFQPYEVATLPTSDNLVGFAGTPDSLVLATRVPNDYTVGVPDANGSTQIITNPDTGISVQLVQFVDHNKAASFWRIAVMFGVAKGNVNCGQRLVSAATGS